MIVGYARVSTADQDLSVQLEALAAASCERVFSEKRSGTKREGRAALEECIASLRAGDVLVVHRLDRLARSLSDLADLIRTLQARNVGFRCIMQSAIDTTTSEGRLMLHVLGAFAEFETDLRRARQADGIARAKKLGVYKGAAPNPHAAEVRQLRASGVAPAEIARRFTARGHRMSERTAYRLAGRAWERT